MAQLGGLLWPARLLRIVRMLSAACFDAAPCFLAVMLSGNWLALSKAKFVSTSATGAILELQRPRADRPRRPITASQHHFL